MARKRSWRVERRVVSEVGVLWAMVGRVEGNAAGEEDGSEGLRGPAASFVPLESEFFRRLALNRVPRLPPPLLPAVPGRPEGAGGREGAGVAGE